MADIDQQALQQQLYMQQQAQLEQEYLMQQQQQQQQQMYEQQLYEQQLQQQQQQQMQQQPFGLQPPSLFGAGGMPQVPNSYVNAVQPMDGGFQIGIPGGFQFYQEPEQPAGPGGAFQFYQDSSYTAEDVYGGDDILTQTKTVAKKKKNNWCGCF